MTISLITRDDCVYCDNAKLLLDNNKRDYTEQKIGVDISREDVVMLFPEYNVLPIVFVDGDPIGGYAELLDHIHPPLVVFDEATNIENPDEFWGIGSPDIPFSDDVNPEPTYAVKNVLEFNSDKEFRIYFKSLLQDNIVEITFEKADESRRVMTCTLKTSLIPQEERDRLVLAANAPKDVNPELQKIWEIEHGQWRSFRYDRLISYQVRD